LHGSEDRIRGLLKKYVKYYQVPDAVINKSPRTGSPAPAAMRVAHSEKVENGDEAEEAAATGS
jgi:hypothetical protein